MNTQVWYKASPTSKSEMYKLRILISPCTDASSAIAELEPRLNQAGLTFHEEKLDADESLSLLILDKDMPSTTESVGAEPDTSVGTCMHAYLIEPAVPIGELEIKLEEAGFMRGLPVTY